MWSAGTPVTSAPRAAVTVSTTSGPDRLRHSYTVWAAPGDRVLATVTVASNSAALVFYPVSVSVTVPTAKDGCAPDLPAIVARDARILHGRVEPPVAGVAVAVNGASLATTTDADGTFHLGPLRDDVVYELVRPDPVSPSPPAMLIGCTQSDEAGPQASLADGGQGRLRVDAPAVRG